MGSNPAAPNGDSYLAAHRHPAANADAIVHSHSHCDAVCHGHSNTTDFPPRDSPATPPNRTVGYSDSP
ncbi:MAG: hypothetical protein JW850_16085 [Thermoflexales bacterium]|nr:hypothetical protein [Thermoflexales bacterium]